MRYSAAFRQDVRNRQMNASQPVQLAPFVGIVIAGAWGRGPVAKTIFLLPLVWISLWLSRERRSTIGFSLPGKTVL